MKATVQHVIQCALSIQENYGIYHTSVGVKLKVKLGKPSFCSNAILSEFQY